MSKKGENIYKRKDGRWEGRYIRFYDEAGKAKYGYVYAHSYTEVKTKLTEKHNASSLQNAIVLRKDSLYGDVLNAWLKSSRISVKESTFARYSHLIDCHIKPSLGYYRLSKISAQLIERYIEQQLNNGRINGSGSLSPKTVADILTIIKSTMEYARRNNMEVICNLNKISIKKKDKEMRVLCPSEQDSLVKVLLSDTDLYKFGVLLSLYTGIRIGELCTLRWENLNLDTRTLSVRETMQRIQDINIGAASKTKVVITEPKSQCSVRDIPLPEFIANIAKRFKGSPKAFILSGDKNKYVEPRTMQNRFKRYTAESGIAKANYHSLRHTFATRCVEVGFEIKSLSEILGHADVNITLNRYVHSSFELKRDNMNKLSIVA